MIENGLSYEQVTMRRSEAVGHRSVHLLGLNFVIRSALFPSFIRYTLSLASARLARREV